MTAGALGGSALLAAWSQVQHLWQLYLIFAGLGAAMAMALYDAATAVVVSWFDARHRPRAILTMIVVAGFASTIFMPLTGLLDAHLGWRHTLLVLAAAYGCVAVPLHALAIRRPAHPGVRDSRPAADRRRERVRAARRDRRFWRLVVAFVAHAAAMSTMTVHLVGFLIARGHPATFAATTVGLLGVLSVTGRLVLTAVQRRVRLTTAVATVFTVQAVAAGALTVAGGSRWGAVGAVVAFGCGFGVAGLATPQMLAERYGTHAYASIAGTVAAPVTFARAAAPLAAAALLDSAGYRSVLAGISGACLLAAAAVGVRATTGGVARADTVDAR
jgi:predicted MFS family arabinose efflux permease